MDLDFKWVEKAKRGRGYSNKGLKTLLRISKVNRRRNKKGEQEYSISFCFYSSAMKKLGLIKGDFVKIGFDVTTKLIAIQRTSDDTSFKLSKSGNTLRIQIRYCCFPFTIDEPLNLDASSLIERDGMFIFNAIGLGIEGKQKKDV